MHVLFYVCVGIGFVDDMRKGLYIIMKSVFKCAVAFDRVQSPDVTLCS